MTYQYKCTNICCKERNIEKDITMPMSEAGETQYCEKCNESLQKIFGSPAVKTGDGYKG